MKLTIALSNDPQDGFRDTGVYVFKGHLTVEQALEKIWEAFEGETDPEWRQFATAEEMFEEVSAIVTHIDTTDLKKIEYLYPADTYEETE